MRVCVVSGIGSKSVMPRRAQNTIMTFANEATPRFVSRTFIYFVVNTAYARTYFAYPIPIHTPLPPTVLCETVLVANIIMSKMVLTAVVAQDPGVCACRVCIAFVSLHFIYLLFCTTLL